MEKMSEDLVWNVSAILHGDAAPVPFAMVVLNTPILTNPATVKSLWKAATSRVTVDGGTNHWLKFIKINDVEDLPLPDRITGDFDSISEEARTYFTSKRVKFVPTPDQDATDFTKSLRELGSMMSHKNLRLHHVLVLGTNCGRVDQIMANLETIHIANNILGDVPVILMSSNSLTWLLAGRRNHIIQVPREFVNKRHAVGLIPLRGATCVTTSGLKWDLVCGMLSGGGISRNAQEQYFHDCANYTDDNPKFLPPQTKWTKYSLHIRFIISPEFIPSFLARAWLFSSPKSVWLACVGCLQRQMIGGWLLAN